MRGTKLVMGGILFVGYPAACTEAPATFPLQSIDSLHLDELGTLTLLLLDPDIYGFKHILSQIICH